MSHLLKLVGDTQENSQGYLIDLMLCMRSLMHFLSIYDKSLCIKSTKIKTNVLPINFHSRSVSYNPSVLQTNICSEHLRLKDAPNNSASDLNKKGYFYI